MGLQTLLCVALLHCIVPGCLSIVGGRDAHSGAWPWMVNLMMHRKMKMYSRGGSLISDQWVMTVGQNMEGFDLQRSFAWVGVLSLEEPSGRQVKLKQVVRHPDFEVKKLLLRNDIALVQLQEAVPFSDTVAPVALPSPRDVFSPDSECWATGWGYIAEGVPLVSKQTLQEVKLSLLDEVTCLNAYPGKISSALCAGDLQGGKDACMNDAGGPLVCVSAGEKKTFVQVGIISYGMGCGRALYPGGYTRVSNYTQFIRDTIQETQCSDLAHFEACFQ